VGAIGEPTIEARVRSEPPNLTGRAPHAAARVGRHR